MLEAAAKGWTGALLAFLLAVPAFAAAPPQSLQEALRGDHAWAGGMTSPPAVARYRMDIGETFVVDRLDRDEALLRFDGDDEIWALKGVNAAHGDMVFKNDLGEPVLRTTRWGGLTLFTPTRPEGMAASLQGGAVALRATVTPLGPQALETVLAQASIRTGRACGHLVAFDAERVPAAVDWIFADAAQLAADAFQRVAQEGRRALAARFSVVRLEPGRSPGVKAEGAAILITVAVDRGLAGRPSSRRIETVVARR